MKRAIVVVDLGFGDAGKGALVDALAEREGATLVVRFNGGAQAAHTVVLPDLRHHTFAQFGSGTFAGAKTYLAPEVSINPAALNREAIHLAQLGIRDPLDKLYIHEDCPVTTPYHIAASRRWTATHPGQSCGMGIWETEDFARRQPEMALYARDLPHRQRVSRKLEAIRQFYQGDGALSFEEILWQFADFGQRAKIIASWPLVRALHETVIFEGAQGVLLDPHVGTKPYTTSKRVTPEAAYALAGDAPAETIGVLRLYMARHGAGPLPTETSRIVAPERHNLANPYQGAMRYGWLDLALIERAVFACGRLDGLAVSHLDHWDALPSWFIATGYADADARIYHEFTDREAYLSFISAYLGLPILTTSDGYTRRSRQWMPKLSAVSP